MLQWSQKLFLYTGSTVAYCYKMIVKTEDNIKVTETHLKNVAERERYWSIEETVKNKEANAKLLLQQRKFKKFN